MSLYYSDKPQQQAPSIITSKTRAKSMPNEFRSLEDLQRAVGSNMHRILNPENLNRTLHDPVYQNRIMEGAEAFRAKHPKPQTDYRIIGDLLNG
jgi:hypothetical protein